MQKNKLKPQKDIDWLVDKKKDIQIKSAIKEDVQWGLYAGLLTKSEVDGVERVIKKGRENSRRRATEMANEF